jgi:hypothetical protein
MSPLAHLACLHVRHIITDFISIVALSATTDASTAIVSAALRALDVVAMEAVPTPEVVPPQWPVPAIGNGFAGATAKAVFDVTRERESRWHSAWSRREAAWRASAASQTQAHATELARVVAEVKAEGARDAATTHEEARRSWAAETLAHGVERDRWTAQKRAHEEAAARMADEHRLLVSRLAVADAMVQKAREALSVLNSLGEHAGVGAT